MKGRHALPAEVGLLGSFGTHHSEAVPAQDRYYDEGERGCHISGVAEGFDRVVVAGSKGITHTGEHGAPDGAADDREDQEFPMAISPSPAAKETKSEEWNESPEQDD